MNAGFLLHTHTLICRQGLFSWVKNMKGRLLLEADNQAEFVVMSWSQELTLQCQEDKP